MTKTAATPRGPSGASPAHTPLTAGALGYRQNLHSLDRSHGFEPLRIEGEIPRDLRGTLYRNGPASFERFGLRYRHWFDGDGAVSAVRFADGRAEGAVRMVAPTGSREEEKRGRALHGGYGTADPGWRPGFLAGAQRNAANTSVVVWQGRLLALWEGGKPTELSPTDLTTLGETDLDGVLAGTFSAHPHRVASRRASYNFGVRYGRETMLDLYELPDEGPARKLGAVALPGATMIHDFAVTEKHLVFFAPPVRLRLLRMLLGVGSYGENLAWRPELGGEILLVPIDDPTRVVRIPVEAFYQWHFANAYERGDGRTVVDFVRYPDFRSNAWLGDVVRAAPGYALDGVLTRAVLDANTKSAAFETLWQGYAEFPRTRGSLQGRAYGTVYAAAYSDSTAAAQGLQDRLLRLDVETGRATLCETGRGQFPSEPVFVGREGATDEDDGYLLSLVYDATADQSHVAVLDARDPSRGALARAWYSHALPFTFHGNFAREAR